MNQRKWLFSFPNSIWECLPQRSALPVKKDNYKLLCLVNVRRGASRKAFPNGVWERAPYITYNYFKNQMVMVGITKFWVATLQMYKVSGFFSFKVYLVKLSESEFTELKNLISASLRYFVSEWFFGKVWFL